MMVDWLVLVPLVVGHLAVFVLTLNVSHSTNMPERLLGPFNLFCLLTTLVALPFLVTSGPCWNWATLPRSYAFVCLAITLVGMPAVTIFRTVRKSPDGIEGRIEDRDLADEVGLDRLVGEGKFHQLLRLPGNRSLHLNKVECRLVIPRLPPALDGLSLVQITDTHFSRAYRREFFELVTDEAATWDADLVAFTGDLLDDPATFDWVEPVFAKLRGRLGQFAILGNHDHRLRPGRARRALRKAGFADLEGRWERFEVDGATLALGGTSAPWGPSLDLDAATDADFRILLSHSPDQFPRAASKGIELVLAGHNHGGQVRLPIFGPILMPSRYSRHFDRGFFRAGKAPSLLYVSQGIGGKHPIRYGCSPEITRFILTAAPAAKPSRVREQAEARLSRGA